MAGGLSQVFPLASHISSISCNAASNSGVYWKSAGGVPKSLDSSYDNKWSSIQ